VEFLLERHGAYFKENMKSLPSFYATMDSNRLTLLYFCVSGLDLLGMLDTVDKDSIVRYVYSLQSDYPDRGGFYGYPTVDFGSEEQNKCNNQPHIANTYVALAMLLILGDDLSRVRREAIAHTLRKWQLPDGSFCCVHGFSSLDSESDIRFVYCAAVICHVLDLWDAIDVELMFGFIIASQSYDRGFGMGPGTEAHGGCTYCALASLAMMGRLADLDGRVELLDWCVKRQHLGFQGRIEKPMDSCYSFWVGASLRLLGAHIFLEAESCIVFLKQCEFMSTGGFQKLPESRAPDLLHSYFSVAGLSLCGRLQPLNCMINVSERAYASAAPWCCKAPHGRALEPMVGLALATAPKSVDGVPGWGPPQPLQRKVAGSSGVWMRCYGAVLASLPYLVIAVAVLMPLLLRLLRYWLSLGGGTSAPIP